MGLLKIEKKEKKYAHIETDEEIDGSLKINFQEMLGEEPGGQMNLNVPDRAMIERQITGQMSTFHYDMIDQIEGAVKMPAMETFPTMIVAVSSGAIDGYVADRPGAVSATSANPDLTYVTFDEGQGFTVSPDDAQIAVGVRQGSELKEQINEILAGISAEERNDIMDAVVLTQPLSE